MADSCAQLDLLNKLETLTVMIFSALSLLLKLSRSLTVCTFGTHSLWDTLTGAW